MYTKSLLILTFIFSSLIVSAQNVGINTTGATPAATNLLEVLQTSTTASSVGIYSAHSGAISGTGYGIWAQKTGASTTNVAGYFSASGATNNYSIIVPSGGGVVGFGTTTPDAKAQLDVTSNGTSAGSMGIYVKQTGAAVGAGYCIRAEKTGASTVANVGGYFSASGGTANYAIIVPSSGGNVGIGTESPSDCAILDISSTTKGILIPRVNLSSTSTYAPLTGTPVDGLMVYNTNVPSTTDGYGNGYYYWSATSTSWVKVSDVEQNSGYTLQGYSGLVTAPSDSRSYFFGGMPFNPGLYVSSGVGECRIYFPKTGVITKCYVNVYTASTLGTNETGSLILSFNRLGTGPSSVTISNAVVNNANNTFYNNTSLSTRVTAGDYFEMRWDTPAWATNPTNVYMSFVLYVE